MSAISDILSQIPIGDLASQLGASQKDTTSAATQAITSLLGGMSANVADGGGDDLTAAIKQHAPTATPKKATTTKSTTTKPTTTAKTAPKKPALDVDTDDGTKIVQHVLGTTPSKAAAAVSEKTGTDQSLLTKLLPILAPIVMTYLASKMTKGSAGGSAVGAGLGGIIGSMLGGGGSSQPATQQQSSSGGIGDLLGGILGQSIGSGNSASSSGGLGGLLSNLF